LIPVSLGGVILFTYGIAEVMKGKFIIEKDSLSQKSLFWTRTLSFTEIRGYRTVNNYTNIFPSDLNKKAIQVSPYLEQSDQIVNWICNKFIELDSHEAIEEEQQILKNDEFGISSQAREYRLQGRRIIKSKN
jgi:hypothetical protein